MILYKKSQPAKWPLWISVTIMCVFTLASFMSNSTDAKHGAMLGQFICLIITLGILIFFGQLRITVTGSHLRLHFGIGIIRKKIALEDIERIHQVRNKWWYGFGVRLTPHGWMWNISGLDAIELKLKTGKIFRVGTANPERLIEILSKQIT